MNVSWESYRVFYYVARHLSFSKASEKLFVSQSAVSQSIRNLEKNLARPLFLRDTKNVKLTVDGEILYEHIKVAITYIKKAENIFSQKKQDSQGEIRLASTDTLCKYFLLPQIKRFRRTDPDIKFIISNHTSTTCLELLDKGEVDFCVINKPTPFNEERYAIHKSISFQDVFVADESYHALKGRTVDVRELPEYPLLVLDKKTVTRAYFDQFFSSAHLAVDPEIELSNTDLLLAMAQSGLGIAFIPEFCLSPSDGLFPIILQTPMPKRALCFISLSKLPLSPLCRRFMDQCQGLNEG